MGLESGECQGPQKRRIAFGWSALIHRVPGWRQSLLVLQACAPVAKRATRTAIVILPIFKASPSLVMICLLDAMLTTHRRYRQHGERLLQGRFTW